MFHNPPCVTPDELAERKRWLANNGYNSAEWKAYLERLKVLREQVGAPSRGLGPCGYGDQAE